MVLGKSRRELRLWERGIKKELQAVPSPLAGRLPEKEPVRQKEQWGEMQWEEDLTKLTHTDNFLLTTAVGYLW